MTRNNSGAYEELNKSRHACIKTVGIFDERRLQSIDARISIDENGESCLFHSPHKIIDNGGTNSPDERFYAPHQFCVFLVVRIVIIQAKPVQTCHAAAGF